MAVRKDARGRWCVEFQSGGTRVFRRCPAGAGKEQAKAYESKLRREAFDGKLGKSAVPSLAAAIQTWLKDTLDQKKDQRMPRQNALHLAPYVTGKSVLQAPEAAQEAVRAWQGTLSPSTINRRLAVLKAACNHAWRNGWVSVNLSGRVRKLSEPEGRKVYLTKAEVMFLARSSPCAQCRAAIMIAAYTGLRASELLALSATTGQQAMLTVSTSKTGKGRSVPIVPAIRPYLRHLPLECSYRTLVGWFWQAREKAGMEHVKFHDLRHTTASLLANAGVDLYVIGKILGHRATQTTARYAHLTDKTVEDAMRRIG